MIAKAAITEFLPIVGIDQAAQLTEAMILRWKAALQKVPSSKRAIHNKHAVVFGTLRWAGFDSTPPLAPRARCRLACE